MFWFDLRRVLGTLIVDGRSKRPVVMGTICIAYSATRWPHMIPMAMGPLSQHPQPNALRWPYNIGDNKGACIEPIRFQGSGGRGLVI